MKRMSQIVVHSGTVYLAGQVGDDMSAGIEQQTRETLANIERLLDLAGTDKTKLLSVTIYLKDIDADFAGMNAVSDKWICPKVLPRPVPRLKRNCANRKILSRAVRRGRFAINNDPSPGADAVSRCRFSPLCRLEACRHASSPCLIDLQACAT